MVNTGRPFQGCFACKERRVKCDAIKPHCQRCKKLKRNCPGYPDIWTVVHRQQNTSAEKHVQARVEKRIKERKQEAFAALSSAPILPNVQLSAEVQSLTQFYYDYTYQSRSALFDSLPLLSDSNSAAFCSNALTAVALASSAQQLQQSFFMFRARKYYGKAIIAANAALRDPLLSKDSSLLLGLFLSGMFETIVADRYGGAAALQSEKTCHPHSKGALALLRFRAEQGLHTENDRNFSKFISQITLMELFTTPSRGMRIWLELEHLTTLWGIGTNVDLVIRQAIDHTARIRTLKTSSAKCLVLPDITSLIQSGVEVALDLEAAAIMTDSLKAENYTSHRHTGAFNGIFLPYNRTTEAIAKSLYRTVSLHVLEPTLDLSISLQEEEGNACDLASPIAVCRAAIATAIERICEDARTVLECDGKQLTDPQPGLPFRVFWMLWPLSAVLMSSFASVSQREWAKSQLRTMGKVSGLGLASLVSGASFEVG